MSNTAIYGQVALVAMGFAALAAPFNSSWRHHVLVFASLCALMVALIFWQAENHWVGIFMPRFAGAVALFTFALLVFYLLGNCLSWATKPRTQQ